MQETIKTHTKPFFSILFGLYFTSFSQLRSNALIHLLKKINKKKNKKIKNKRKLNLEKFSYLKYFNLQKLNIKSMMKVLIYGVVDYYY